MAARDLTVPPQRAVDTREPQAGGSSARKAAIDQVVVGAIPQEPPGFQPPTGPLAALGRAGLSVANVITGREGAGKSQLAAAYAREKLAEGWRLVAWVNAKDTGSLLAGLAAVADAARLPDGGSGRGAADAGRAVRRWLETDGDHCLLVFDDASDPDALRPFLPTRGAARVLITSDRKVATNLGTSIPFEVFSLEEALAFLAGRTGLADGAGAAAVAAELGYLPLALAQAAGVIAGQHIGYRTYLNRLRALPVDECLAPRQRQPYPHRVAEAVLLSLDAVQARDQAGASTGVMEVVAVLSAAGVRRDLLYAAGHAGVLSRRRHRYQVSAALVDRALARLAERSLLAFSLDGQTIIAHRVVMRLVRDGLARQGRLAAVCQGVASVLDARAAILAGSPDRIAVRDVPAHVAALVENACMPVADVDEELVRLLLSPRFWALYHLNELGDSASQAIVVGESLVADFERIMGPDHPDTLGSRNSLALAYLGAGRAVEAVPLLEQILVGQERLLGPDHPDTMTSRENLAAAYRDVGRLPEAILLLELTLADRQRLLDPGHPETLSAQKDLAAAYRDVGRVAEAIPLFEQNLAAHERLLGPDHPDTLRCQDNLANAYRDAGRLPEAIPLIEQMLAAYEGMVGTDHPRTLAWRNNLAVVYRATGRIAEAIPLFEQNLAACGRLLGVDHPKTLASRNNLALAHRELSYLRPAPDPAKP